MKVEYLILKEENTYCGSKEAFLNLLASNEDLKINGNTLKYKKNDIKITIQTDIPQLIDKKERYFHLLLEKDTNEKNIESIILLIQEVCKIIKTIIKNSNYGFRINTLWDDISFYYSKQSYPLINEIENLMRKLIFKFMCINVGMNWLEEATPKEVREKILSRSDTANVKDLFEDCLYEADFIHLANFLFKEYSTISIEDLIKNVSKAKKIEDLKLKDIKEIIPKSNWDRYFSKIIKFAGLNNKWKELYDYRNLVAHNRPLNKSNYQRIEIITSEIKEKITDAIKKIDDVHIPENKKKEVTDFAISDFMKSSPSRIYNLSSMNDISGIVNLGSTFISGGYQDNVYTGSLHNSHLSSNANCITCGKTYMKSVLLGTHITGRCDECTNGIAYSPFLNNKICISCGNSFMPKPGEIILTSECENCRFGDRILVTNSKNSK